MTNLKYFKSSLNALQSLFLLVLLGAEQTDRTVTQWCQQTLLFTCQQRATASNMWDLHDIRFSFHPPNIQEVEVWTLSHLQRQALVFVGKQKPQ